MDEQKNLKIAEEINEKVQKKGADLSEVYVESSRALSIDVRDQEVDTMKTAEEKGIGLRVIKGLKMGFAFTTDFSPESLDNLIQQALANSQKAAFDESNVLPVPSQKYADVNIFDSAVGQIPIKEKIEIAKNIEKIGRDYDSRVKITESCTYKDSEYAVAIMNSEGVSSAYKGTVAGAYSHFVAEEDGDFQTGLGLQFSTRFSDLNPQSIGEEGAEKAVSMLGASEVNTQKASIVLDPYVATNFLGVIAPAVTAEAVQKGKSLFAGKVGEQVASELITIVDDGRMEGGIVTAPFDGEGAAAERTVLIEDGKLNGFLHNTYTASKEGLTSTGNGVRSNSFKAVPEVGTTNFYIESGTTSREKLISEISNGLYITEVMGMHTANPISGDFSLGVSGIWIKNGEFTVPVRGAAVAGNILDFLSDVDCVGDDLRFFADSGAPTIRISSMTVSGG